MKKAAFYIVAIALVSLLFVFATPQIDRSTQVHFSKWLTDYKDSAKNDADKTEVLIKFIQKGNPQSEHIISAEHRQKILRVLYLLKETEAFNNTVKNSKNGDYLISVENGDNKFEGYLPQKRLQKDIRMQVLLKLVEIV